MYVMCYVFLLSVMPMNNFLIIFFGKHLGVYGNMLCITSVLQYSCYLFMILVIYRITCHDTVTTLLQ